MSPVGSGACCHALVAVSVPEHSRIGTVSTSCFPEERLLQLGDRPSPLGLWWDRPSLGGSGGTVLLLGDSGGTVRPLGALVGLSIPLGSGGTVFLLGGSGGTVCPSRALVGLSFSLGALLVVTLGPVSGKAESLGCFHLKGVASCLA